MISFFLTPQWNPTWITTNSPEPIYRLWAYFQTKDSLLKKGNFGLCDRKYKQRWGQNSCSENPYTHTQGQLDQQQGSLSPQGSHGWDMFHVRPAWENMGAWAPVTQDSSLENQAGLCMPNGKHFLWEIWVETGDEWAGWTPTKSELADQNPCKQDRTHKNDNTTHRTAPTWPLMSAWASQARRNSARS